jgi:hypothetical protein
MQCAPNAYLHTVDSFEEACLTGHKHDESGGIFVTYDRSVPRKAVHLIRNPFDNIVGRMHLSTKRRDTDDLYTTTPEGLAAWCRDADERYRKEENSIMSQYESLPCRGEWYRYIQWHNLAVQVQKRLQIPVHRLYYENYTYALEETVDGLLSFLELNQKYPPLEFISQKHYIDLFDADHARKAAFFARNLSAPETWQLLQHFFTEWLEDSTQDASGELTEDKGTLLSQGALSVTASQPQVAWLLSFPNSVSVLCPQ